MLDLPLRPDKPRKKGITAIHDVFLTVGQLEDILVDYSEFLDISKFGVGTAYITRKLDKKIKLFHEYGVKPYFGGTLFEKYYVNNKVDEYLKFLDKHNITILEVSTGTIDISLENRIELVERLSKNFTVLTEVGSKDADTIMSPSEWIYEINSLMEAGAKYVITEGRNSGTAGIYRPSGEMRTGLIEDILRSCDVDSIIFEAPTPKAQMHFINRVGSNVNLGNVNPMDLLLLESQRLGLRSETFYIK